MKSFMTKDWTVTFYCSCGSGFKATGNSESDRLASERVRAMIVAEHFGLNHVETDVAHARRARNRKDGRTMNGLGTQS